MADFDQETPVFDLLDGLAPPHQQELFFGHAKEEAAFLDAWNSGKIHHAWLLAGPKGIGKATFAFRAARFILNEGEGASAALFGASHPNSMDVRADSHSARLVSNLAHPNLLVISRPFDQKSKKFKTEITVDEVRRTVRFFGSTAGENAWRVCVVDPADELNGNAANALLKVLEEPPARTIFFLIAHAPGRLLPTIRSRCRKLALSPLENPDLSEAIIALDIAQSETASQLSAACDGSLRKAADLQSDDGLVLINAFDRLLQPPFNPDYESLHAFAEIVDQRGKEQRFDGFSDLAHRYLTETMHQFSRNDKKTSADINALSQAWDRAGTLIRETRSFNLDKKQTIIEVIRLLAKASRGPLN